VLIAALCWWIADVAQGGALGPWRDDPLVAIDRASPVDALPDIEAPICVSIPRAMVSLDQRPDLYTLVNPMNAWGSPYLTDLLVATAEELAILLPEADPILIGDISRRGGGPLYGHRTHNLGIDVDVGLYTTNGKQQITSFPELGKRNLDFEASWLLVKKLLDSGRVEFILLDQGIIDLMRAWALENGRITEAEAERIFPAPNTPRLWERHSYVRNAANHRDHIHVRVRCEGGGTSLVAAEQ
jgi:murein endopeptidase